MNEKERGNTMKIRIALGMLVRQNKIVTVEVPDDFLSWQDDTKRELLHDVYDADEGDGFTDDQEWGCEEATHYLLGPSDEDFADYRRSEDGVIQRVAEATDVAELPRTEAAETDGRKSP
jgi:hypothetical protein